jgi:hypothetical protein
MTKDQGWHGDSKGHARAAKGMKKKGEQGWHGDSEGHAKAAKGESKTRRTLRERLFGE